MAVLSKVDLGCDMKVREVLTGIAFGILGAWTALYTRAMAKVLEQYEKCCHAICD